MSTFLGIGAGPIQTGIFISGASQGGYTRLVLADVDRALIDTVRAAGAITVNTACRDAARSDTYTRVEIYNPGDPAELAVLTQIAAEAKAICTALPSTAFFKDVAPWLSEAFQSATGQRRYVFTAENSTTAAHELQAAVGTFPNTYYLDTVIGKMSKVFTTDESALPPLAPGLNRGHLVEAFNAIYTSDAPGISDLGIIGLHPKTDLSPFEEAKLYGHNTAHFLLAFLAAERGCRYMDDVNAHPDLPDQTRQVLIEECGAALCRKHSGVDDFFESARFAEFASELVDRMTSPVLNDSVERVIRDPQRKLGWNDRMIGAIRLCREQDVRPAQLLSVTAAMVKKTFGSERGAIVDGLSRLWAGGPEQDVSLLRDELLRQDRP